MIRVDKNGEQIREKLFIILQFSQDLWQAPYQILIIIFLKEFIKLNVNAEMVIENAKFSELNKDIATVFLEPKSCMKT